MDNTEMIRTAWQEAFHTRSRNKFDKTDSVSNAPKTGRPKTSMTEENKTLVALTYINCPKNLHDVLLLNFPCQEHHCDAYCTT